MRRTMTTILVFTMLVALPGIALAAAAGDLDPSFGTGGSTSPIPGFAEDVALQSDGKIIGLAEETLARWNSDGSLDTTFGSSGSVRVYHNAPRLVAMQPREGAEFVLVDHHLWEWGEGFQAVGGTVGVYRYTPSGALDQTFSAKMEFTNGDLPSSEDLEVQPDGGIIQVIEVRHMKHEVCTINNCLMDPRPHSNMLVRYRPDGGLDETFGDGGIVHLERTGQPFDNVDVAIQPDGRLVMAKAVQGGVLVRRLQADGSLDPTFAPTTVPAPPGFTGSPAIAIDADGNIIVAAAACSYPRTDCETQVRKLQRDGGPDVTFAEARIAGVPRELEIDATGAILVVDFQRITRLMPSGQIDETFGSNGSVAVDNRAVEVQPDRKIVILRWGGPYWAYETFVSRYLGSADATEPPPPVTTGTIAGSVTTTSGTAIAEAVIDCGAGGSSTSSSSGEYSITDVPEGSYHCTASASGYRSKKQHVAVRAGESTTADFQLHPGRNP